MNKINNISHQVNESNGRIISIDTPGRGPNKSSIKKQIGQQAINSQREKINKQYFDSPQRPKQLNFQNQSV